MFKIPNGHMCRRILRGKICLNGTRKGFGRDYRCMCCTEMVLGLKNYIMGLDVFVESAWGLACLAVGYLRPWAAYHAITYEGLNWEFSN